MSRKHAWAHAVFCELNYAQAAPQTLQPTVTYGKLDDSPSANLGFPTGNITAAEIVAIFPQWLKSWDVIDRLVSNGARSATIRNMLNAMRTMPKGNIESNTILRMWQGSLKTRGAGFQKWSPGTHQASATHDGTSVSVRNFRTPSVTHGARGANRGGACMRLVPGGIPVKDLAIGVKAMPTADDALDLTRAITYHLNHPNEICNFPADYDRLVTHIGGPNPVRPANHDSAVFRRWE